MSMTLSDYIEKVGEEKAAEIGGVTIRAIQAYRRGERVPRPPTAARFVAHAAGELGYEGIYAPRTDSKGGGVAGEAA